MHKRSAILAELFLSMMKVGLFTFGGGYAMISVLTNTCVEKKRWLTQDEMMNLTVVAESTPGPIAINCATYVGYKTAGMMGAIWATLGLILPSFAILFFISLYLDRVLEIPRMAAACRGIRIGAGLLILDAGLAMLRRIKGKRQPCFIAGGAFVLMLAGNLLGMRISSIALMLAAGAVSLALYAARQAAGRKGGAGN